MNTFQEYFVDVFRYKYADFSGRARRSEYWFFTLYKIIFFFGLVILSGSLGSIIGSETFGYSIIIYALYIVAIIIPSIAVLVRRLHDTGNTGWLYLISLIPFGSIILFVFCCIEGSRGPNKWGRNPKEEIIDRDNVSEHLIESFNDI